MRQGEMRQVVTGGGEERRGVAKGGSFGKPAGTAAHRCQVQLESELSLHSSLFPLLFALRVCCSRTAWAWQLPWVGCLQAAQIASII